jgi:hypothetical protein
MGLGRGGCTSDTERQIGVTVHGLGEKTVMGELSWGSHQKA